MIKTLQTTLKQDKEQFKVPRSVQDIIPIRRLWPDGIFQSGSKYSKTLRFSDINYAIASKEDKTAMFLGYSELLNALDTGSTTKITINNKRINRQNFEQDILIPPQGDYLDGFRAEYNAMLLDKVTDSSNSVVQERYITLSVHKKNVEEARTFFDRTVNDAVSRLNHMDSHCEELDAVERLRILHDFYRVGEETQYHLDLHECMKQGRSFKDAICPDSMEFAADHFKLDARYGRVLYLQDYASYAASCCPSTSFPFPRTRRCARCRTACWAWKPTSPTGNAARTATITSPRSCLMIWSSSARRPVKCWTISPPEISA